MNGNKIEMDWKKKTHLGVFHFSASAMMQCGGNMLLLDLFNLGPRAINYACRQLPACRPNDLTTSSVAGKQNLKPVRQDR